MTRRGFPHSDIPGSKLVCSSPRLFAADRVLHRLLAPRHSPCALSSLTIGMQELTMARPFANALPTVPLPNPHLETLRVFCGYGKNYRLQDIQLRKNIANLSIDVRDNRSRRHPLSAFATSPRSAKAGGEYRARTGDLLVANQALSQLS